MAPVTAVREGPTALMARLIAYEKEACEYSLQLFHEAGITHLDQWLADYAACDLLLDFYRTGVSPAVPLLLDRQRTTAGTPLHSILHADEVGVPVDRHRRLTILISRETQRSESFCAPCRRSVSAERTHLVGTGSDNPPCRRYAHLSKGARSCR